MYSATLGRFLQSDPLSYAAGDMNLYAYVGNDPINKIDPRGLMETVIVTGSRWDPWFWWYTPFMYPTHVFTGGMGFAPGTVSGEAVGNPPTQGEKPLPQCTRSLDFDFNQFPDQIEENRLDLGATLATLFAAEAIGTMPKTPSELRGLGVPKSELNPYTSQASRWSHRIGRRPLQEFGRTGLGMAASTVATLGVVFEGFYDWGVIGKAAWDATSLRGCSP